MNTKNPFRGIACRSPRKPKWSRRIDGARDTRPTYRNRSRETRPFRDSNYHPVAFVR